MTAGGAITSLRAAITQTAVAAALLGIPACSRAPRDANTLHRVAVEAKLQVPSGARLLEFSEYEALFDPVWAAKVSIPAVSQAAFAKQVSDKPLDSTARSGTYAASVPWWRPQHAVLTKQYLADTNTLVTVVVAEESGQAAAYIECTIF